MKIVGCDFHPSYQQVAIFDTTTGEVEERKLGHSDGEAEGFYRELQAGALLGMESLGNAQWFQRLVEGLGHQPLDWGCSPDPSQLCAQAEDR
jgi:transposase